MSISYTTFSNVQPDPTLASAKEGVQAMESFKPDCIIAIGGGSAMDAAKIMWVMYEHPEVDFMDMAMRFSDIRKRIYTFPKMGEKAYFIAVPTSSGTGSEVTPFAVITDEKTGIKYALADYELMPKMAIVDTDMMMDAPKGLTSASGIDAVTHCLEAYASMMATEYTDGLAIESLKNIFNLIKLNPNITYDMLAKETGLSRDGIKYNIKRLKKLLLIKKPTIRSEFIIIDDINRPCAVMSLDTDIKNAVAPIKALTILL